MHTMRNYMYCRLQPDAGDNVSTLFEKSSLLTAETS